MMSTAQPLASIRIVQFVRNPDRPLLFSVVFWLVLAVPVLHAVWAPGEPHGRFGLVPLVTAEALLAVMWLVLPWKSGATRRRRLLSPVFLASAFGTALLGGYGTEGPLLVVALANVVFVFGIRIGVALSVLLHTTMLLGVALLAGRSWTDALGQTLSLGIMTACMLGLAAAVFDARQQRQQTRRLFGELEAAHAELGRHVQRVRELTVAEERARMARDMHDSIGHYLTVVKVGLENAERFRGRRPQAAWGEVREAKKLTQEALTETRRWVRALRPLALDGQSGRAALAALARSFEGTGIDVRFQVEGPESVLDSDVELVLYRVLQEGLTNTLRHAGARTATAALTFTADRVTLSVGDDGHGAPVDAGGPGFGLSSLRERAAALGGRLDSGNGAGGGYLLRVDLPVRAGGGGG